MLNKRLQKKYFAIVISFLLQVCMGPVGNRVLAQTNPPKSGVITDIWFDTATYKELAPGSDNFPTTWGNNGHIYTSWGDGGGFGGTNDIGRVSLGFARIENYPPSISTYNVMGGVNTQCPATLTGKSYGMLDIGGTLYAWISPSSNTTNYQKTTLYKSTNSGCSWSSTSVEFYQSQNLILPSILQYGAGYSDAPDSYVYSYATRLKTSSALTIQSPGEIDLMRVAKTQISNRSSYEFFKGFDSNNNPLWTTDINLRQPVIKISTGVGWAPATVSYNKGLGRYLMAVDDAAAGVTGVSGKGLGIYDAAKPWGPWTLVKQINTFTYEPTFFYNFPTKWISSDGKTLWMVFSGTNDYDSYNMVKATLVTSSATPTPTSIPTNTNTPTPLPKFTSTLTPTPKATNTVTPTTTVNGDANGDGSVNELDYAIWKTNYNTTTASGVTKGDFNLNGKVDGVDYLIWLQSYTQ